MIIEKNPIMLEAMEYFHKGDRPEGLRIQEEFCAAFREAYENADHCSCTKDCRYHGNCKECVAIHRAHQEHVPNCMRPIINSKLKLLSEITEHTVVDEIRPEEEAPEEKPERKHRDRITESVMKAGRAHRRRTFGVKHEDK